MDKQIKILSPSYRRHSVCTSHKIFGDDLYYVIRENEYSLYKNITSNLITIPDGLVSNLTNTRNWILNNIDHKYILMVDDDYKSVIWNLKRNLKKLSINEIIDVIENGFSMCDESGIKLWGLNVNSDPMSYTISKPFSFSNMILGPWQGIIKTELRYDETLYLKEDYDFSLQNLKNFRKVLRFNFLSYYVDHESLAGGCQTYRTSENEIEQNNMLLNKWGSDIIKYNNRYDRDTINMIVKSPI